MDRVITVFNFNATDPGKLSFKKGETLVVLGRKYKQWWLCENQRGMRGTVPCNNIKLLGNPTTTISGKSTPISRSTTTREVVSQLLAHGCQDLTTKLDLSSSGEYLVCHDESSNVYLGRLRNGTGVDVKALRVSVDGTSGNPTHLKHAARELYTWGKCTYSNVIRLFGLANLEGANILVSDERIPVLADFGDCSLVDRTLGFTQTTSGPSFTVRWSAPEVIEEITPHTKASDVYVLGMVNRIYPEHTVASVISVGAGHARTIQVPNPSRWLRTQDVMVMRDMETDSERVAEEMIARFEGTSDVYFRFNVGLARPFEVEHTWDNWDPVIYLDASSAEALEKALHGFGKAKNIGEEYTDVINWLESCSELWLMVFDNADTPAIKVEQYIPARGERGSILITTRLPDLANLADSLDSMYPLSGMSLTGGTTLLVKIASSRNQRLSEDNTKLAGELVQDFGCLTLAIVHAGAYIAHLPGMTITEYRSLFLSQRQRMLEEYSELPAAAKLEKRGDTVYTTCKMCYDQLNPESSARGD
ncbi:Nephrocystin-1 [Rhizoctonia solani]|uniref:Nephrocystin-1 n=1 Tax=Rhizoctonia solani TaxID=456999 RepID=A0A0K6FXU2_9AGAM|nr:Nephrocystin-1 [Rhizoctonia solani]